MPATPVVVVPLLYHFGKLSQRQNSSRALTLLERRVSVQIDT